MVTHKVNQELTCIGLGAGPDIGRVCPECLIGRQAAKPYGRSQGLSGYVVCDSHGQLTLAPQDMRHITLIRAFHIQRYKRLSNALVYTYTTPNCYTGRGPIERKFVKRVMWNGFSIVVSIRAEDFLGYPKIGNPDLGVCQELTVDEKMGNLLRLLTREEPPKPDIFVDFENAQPTDSERETYESAESVLRNSVEILLELHQYKGAGNEIREAIANPRSGNLQERAWQVVIPLVSKLKRFYEFSLELEMIVPKILWQLCSGTQSPVAHLETQQALAKQFAEILEFVLKFDDLKMTNPAIQNDFSYYRRTMSRLRMCNQEEVEMEIAVTNELANRMSLFYAHATPMLKVLSDTTTKFVAENKDLPIENTTETLGTMAKVCQRMVENPEFLQRFKNEETVLFVLRVMVGLIILYDHVHPVGAFARNSHVDIKGCIKVLKEQPAPNAEGLLNALR
uniref:CYRIA/CYRIB Rac1 binding domain-containing protein n=1 Tax=Strigamia maritima TaxID=126957 RepID=T1JF15_STRMM